MPKMSGHKTRAESHGYLMPPHVRPRIMAVVEEMMSMLPLAGGRKKERERASGKTTSSRKKGEARQR